MTMPEAPMHENDFGVSGEHDIRSPGKVTSMKSKSKSHSMSQGANLYFRLCVAPFHPAHYPTSFPLHEDVCHIM